MKSARLLFLIGYRGTGKTTTARLLAGHLGWRWLDADALLEEHAGRTIRQIFASEGEAHFRELEAQILQELSERQDHVIATGGGIVLRADNRALLQRGNVVWLQASPAVLWQRMQQDASTRERRPDLAQGGLQEIEDLLRQRTPHYEACHDFAVDTGQQAPAQVAQAIHDWFVKRHSFSPAS